VKNFVDDEDSGMVLSTPTLRTPGPSMRTPGPSMRTLGPEGEAELHARENPRSKIQSLLRQRSSIPELLSFEDKIAEEVLGEGCRKVLDEETLRMASASISNMGSMTHFTKGHATLSLEANIKRKLKSKNAVARDVEVVVPDDTNVVEAFSFVGNERRIVLMKPGYYQVDSFKPTRNPASRVDVVEPILVDGCAFVSPHEDVSRQPARWKQSDESTRRGLEERPESVVIEGQFFMTERSNGNFYSIRFQGSTDSIPSNGKEDCDDDSSIMLLIRGGPWKFERCDMKSSEGCICSITQNSTVEFISCKFGSTHSSDSQYSNAIATYERSLLIVKDCVFRDASLAAIKVSGASKSKIMESGFENNCFSVGMFMQAFVHIERCAFFRTSSSIFVLDSDWTAGDPQERQGSSMKVLDCIFDDLPWTQTQRPISFSERNNRLLLLRRRNGIWGEGGRLEDRECFTPTSSSRKKWVLMGPNMTAPPAGLPIGGMETWVPYGSIESLTEDVPNFSPEGTVNSVLRA